MRILAELAEVRPPGNLPHVTGTESDLEMMLRIVFGIIGAASLLIITVSGLRYITSAGDPQKSSNAKNGIIYALIGLTIAIFAQAILVFVVERL